MEALIIVDIQNDFLPGGALEVPGGNEIIPLVNSLQPKFDLIVATQDWHPAGHGSFASSHKGKKPGDSFLLNGLDQILWPDHCVQGSGGAEFSKDLDVSRIDKIIQKGTDPGIDSYSGFFDNGKKKDTGLDKYLKGRGVEKVFIVGLATDYCVKFTALDAVSSGYKTTVISDATRAVNLQPGDFEKAVKEMRNAGIEVL
jgi:nicotinamidase/pyrazinamidase